MPPSSIVCHVVAFVCDLFAHWLVSYATILNTAVGDGVSRVSPLSVGFS
jgi:hypothetical protein